VPLLWQLLPKLFFETFEAIEYEILLRDSEIVTLKKFRLKLRYYYYYLAYDMIVYELVLPCYVRLYAMSMLVPTTDTPRGYLLPVPSLFVYPHV
jgi:hypothetical protein